MYGETRFVQHVLGVPCRDAATNLDGDPHDAEEIPMSSVRARDNWIALLLNFEAVSDGDYCSTESTAFIMESMTMAKVASKPLTIEGVGGIHWVHPRVAEGKPSRILFALGFDSWHLLARTLAKTSCGGFASPPHRG